MPKKRKASEPISEDIPWKDISFTEVSHSKVRVNIKSDNDLELSERIYHALYSRVSKSHHPIHVEKTGSLLSVVLLDRNDSNSVVSYLKCLGLYSQQSAQATGSLLIKFFISNSNETENSPEKLRDEQERKLREMKKILDNYSVNPSSDLQRESIPHEHEEPPVKRVRVKVKKEKLTEEEKQKQEHLKKMAACLGKFSFVKHYQEKENNAGLKSPKEEAPTEELDEIDPMQYLNV